HCHVRPSPHTYFAERGIPEIADLNVMPECRRNGAASALLDFAESLIAQTSEYAGIGVGVYDDYGPAQRLYTGRGYVFDGSGAWAAQVYVVAVVPGMQRHGVGRLMLDEAEAWLRGLGVEYLQVKTLSASHPDAGYATTRAFYEAVGFRPLEEFPLPWDPAN